MFENCKMVVIDLLAVTGHVDRKRRLSNNESVPLEDPDGPKKETE